jgi:hypothetical protein
MSLNAATEDFLSLRLVHMIDLRHTLAVLSSRMPWQQIEASVAHLFSGKVRAGKKLPGVDLFGEQIQTAAVKSNSGRPRVPCAIFLHDIQRGDVQIDPRRTFRDYLTDYKAQAKNKEIAAIVACLSIEKAKLSALMNTHVTAAILNEFGRFDDLRETVDQQKAKADFEGLEGTTLSMGRVNVKAAKLLSDFLLQGGLQGIELKKTGK